MSYLYNPVKTCTSNIDIYQRIRHRLLGQSINRRFNKRRMFIQPQKDNRLTCQTWFQVKSGKGCSRTNSINYVSWIANDSVLMNLLVPKEKKKKCHQGNKKLLKLDRCSPRKLAGLKES
ncbi:hypothetical protein ACTFIW_013339 [Dictyostelium discoideum]